MVDVKTVQEILSQTFLSNVGEDDYARVEDTLKQYLQFCDAYKPSTNGSDYDAMCKFCSTADLKYYKATLNDDGESGLLWISKTSNVHLSLAKQLARQLPPLSQQDDDYLRTCNGKKGGHGTVVTHPEMPGRIYKKCKNALAVHEIIVMQILAHDPVLGQFIPTLHSITVGQDGNPVIEMARVITIAMNAELSIEVQVHLTIQLLYFLYVLHERYGGMHGDLHCGNLGIVVLRDAIVINEDQQYGLPTISTKYLLQVYDFGMTELCGIPNPYTYLEEDNMYDEMTLRSCYSYTPVVDLLCTHLNMFKVDFDIGLFLAMLKSDVLPTGAPFHILKEYVELCMKDTDTVVNQTCHHKKEAKFKHCYMNALAGPLISLSWRSLEQLTAHVSETIVPLLVQLEVE